VNTKDEKEIWDECLKELELSSATMLAQSASDPFRRTYLWDGNVYKLAILDLSTTGYLRNNDLFKEHKILSHCSGIRGIPLPINYIRKRNFECLVTEKLPGNPLGSVKTSWFHVFLVFVKLIRIVVNLSLRGVSHNDLVPRNVLVTDSGKVSLIDFDQSTRCNNVLALIRQFFWIRTGQGEIKASMITFIKEYLKTRLSEKSIRRYRKLKSKIWQKKINRLPYIPESADSKVKTLLDAWKIAQKSDASSPDMSIAYYSLNFEGYHFPGERPWEKRWKTLRDITDYSEKRILELGCNMALLSAFLLKERHAKKALAIDSDDSILEAAKCFASVLGVSPIFQKYDFDSPDNWEMKISDFSPDIVFALNVLNWVNDKERFLNFLSGFDELIYEGHDSLDAEIERLKSVGFSKIDMITQSERSRYVLHCTK
jgi:serine/threonine protein kinase